MRGPEEVVAHLLDLETATVQMGLIPEAFAVVNVDARRLRISEGAGLHHVSFLLADRVARLSTIPHPGPLEERLLEHLDHRTSAIRLLFLRRLRERWAGWDVREVKGPAEL